MKLVEKMARAIAMARGLEAGQWPHFKTAALAALRAMREPTEAMLDAYSEGIKSALLSSDAYHIDIDGWHAMIDAAIQEAEAK